MENREKYYKLMEEQYKNYFSFISNYVKKAYEIANEAHKKGYDPDDKVDIPVANNMAERVVNLVSANHPEIVNKGIPKRISELEEKYGANDWRVALSIAGEVFQEKFCKFKDKVEALEVAERIGLAYITLGVVSAPLEGFSHFKIKKRKDGKDYLAIYYAGPIRASGGTAASVSLLIADYLRILANLFPYDPSEKEVKRYEVELSDYHVSERLQYKPSNEEIDFLVKNIPIEINGVPTLDREVSNYKGLPRVETDRIRGGMCLVLGEGIAQKAKKVFKRVSKWGKDFNLNHWVPFLDEFLQLQKKVLNKSKNKEDKQEDVKIVPNYRFLKDTVAGRPIFAYPLAKGGFRQRYGRTRYVGHDSLAINPATMILSNNFIAIGTQLAIERPGKGCTTTPCEYIDGPVVLLEDGTLMYVNTIQDALKIKDKVKEILVLGDILVNYGAYAEHGHNLTPSPWVEEWWALELKEKNPSNIWVKDPLRKKPSAKEAIDLSLKYDIPLHPKYNYYWEDINKEDILTLYKFFKENIKLQNLKDVLVNLKIPHKGDLSFNEDDLFVMNFIFSKVNEEDVINSIKNSKNSLEAINKISPIKIMRKAGIYIGARMGRPEKASMRTLRGKPHMLFPVGEQGERLRSFNKALEHGYIESAFPNYYCENCKKIVVSGVCPYCGSKTKLLRTCQKCKKQTFELYHCGERTKAYSVRKINIKEYMKLALKKVGMKEIPPLVKGVRGTSNKDRIIEPLEKGLLRAKHNIYVNKDGTIRLDFTELGLTAFKPKEIGTSIKKLKELGYTYDIYGNPLENEDQIVELKVQDVIVPDIDNIPSAKLGDVLYRISKFVDDELEKLYELSSFYNAKSKEDIVGHLAIALAPHTSAGTIVRIIGFSQVQGLLAHPLLHAACRRDLDGDEIGLMLLMDALLNFSRQYLPDKVGGRTMDAPLVITAKLIPEEVDDEVFDVDVMWEYPLEFYRKTQEWAPFYDVKIEQIKDRIGKPNEYYDFGFTHPVDSINDGVNISAYKTLETMSDKVFQEMDVVSKIKAVDVKDVVKLMIERHYLRDIKGNFRKFSLQTFRCVNCNEKFRRVPLGGRCPKCGGRIIFTIAEGSVLKYFEPTVKLLEKYGSTEYMKQTINLLKESIEYIFGKEKEKQTGLTSFFKT